MGDCAFSDMKEDTTAVNVDGLLWDHTAFTLTRRQKSCCEFMISKWLFVTEGI